MGLGASGSTCTPALTKWRFSKLPMDAGEALVGPLRPHHLRFFHSLSSPFCGRQTASLPVSLMK